MSAILSGKTAIVTGASSGIGRATAIALADAGAAVVVTARRLNMLEELASTIAADGGKALPVAADMRNEKDIDALLEQALAWQDGGGKCDILVANAGRGLKGGVLDSDESTWQALYQLNVLGVARLLRRAGSHMVARNGGDVVVVGSVVGKNISPWSGVYGSSKHAVDSLVEGFRREVCQHGVRVSLVMPGIVVSEFQGSAGYDDSLFENWNAQFGPLLEPEVIADGITWLLSQPPHVNVNEIMIRPTRQTYP